MKKSTLILALIGALLLAACSESLGEASADFCAAEAGLASAVDELGTLNPQSTASELEQVKKDISDAWDDYETAAEDTNEAAKTEAQRAYTDYLNAVEVIPGSGSLGERVQAHIDAAKVLVADLKIIADASKCT